VVVSGEEEACKGGKNAGERTDDDEEEKMQQVDSIRGTILAARFRLAREKKKSRTRGGEKRSRRNGSDPSLLGFPAENARILSGTRGKQNPKRRKNHSRKERGREFKAPAGGPM